MNQTVSRISACEVGKPLTETVFTPTGAQRHSAWQRSAWRHPACCRWYAGAREWCADSAPVARRSARQSIPLRAGGAPLAHVVLIQVMQAGKISMKQVER